MRRLTRFAVVIVLGGALVVALVVNRNRPERVVASFGAAPTIVQPVASGEGTVNTAWLCPGGPAPADGSAAVFVTAANPTPEARRATLTVYPNSGPSQSRLLVLAAYSRTSVNLAEVAAAPFAAAAIEVFGPGVVVEQTVAAGDVRDSSACASAASPTWYLANGSTSKDARLTFQLLNPFPDDAVIDMSFVTEEGPFAPQALQGFVVPAQSMRVVDVSDQVRRRDHVAATLTVRTGRVAAGRIQAFDGTAGRTGFTTGLLAPSPATDWYFPDGRKGPNIAERVVVYNPTDREAAVDLRVQASGASPTDLVEPAALTVPAGQAATFDVTSNDTVAEGSHSIVASSSNGVPVVVERAIDLLAPSASQGVTSLLGSRVAANHWLLAVGGTSSALVEEITVLNTTAQPVVAHLSTLESTGLVAIPPDDGIEVPPGAAVRVKLNDLLSRAPFTLEVDADGAIVVERGLVNVGAAGTSRQLGVPLPA